MEQCVTQIADQHTEFAAHLKVDLIDSLGTFVREKEPRRKEVCTQSLACVCAGTVNRTFVERSCCIRLATE
jgi:hypothetical protein